MVQNNSGMNFLMSAGENTTDKGADDVPYLKPASSRFFDVLDTVNRIANTPNLFMFQNDNPGGFVGQQTIFEEGRALFFAEVLQLAERMRASEVDFGILPYPKYDEAQANYYTFGDSWCMNHMLVPITNKNLDKTGMILEILNAESYYTVRPAYIERAIHSKFFRDEDSIEMLDIIFASKVISLDEIFGWGMFGALNNEVFTDGNFASAVESNETRVQRAIESSMSRID